MRIPARRNPLASSAAEPAKIARDNKLQRGLRPDDVSVAAPVALRLFIPASYRKRRVGGEYQPDEPPMQKRSRAAASLIANRAYPPGTFRNSPLGADSLYHLAQGNDPRSPGSRAATTVSQTVTVRHAECDVVRAVDHTSSLHFLAEHTPVSFLQKNSRYVRGLAQ